MAMTACKECGHAVSTKAEACPSCGAKRPKKTSFVTWLVAFFIGVPLIVSIIGAFGSSPSPTTASKPTPRPPPDPKAEARFQMAALGLRALKQSMKNPASFQLTNAIAIGDDTFCYEYRATNSFNAVVPGHFVWVPSAKVSSESAAAWNKHCANKTGEDITYVRQTL